MASAAALSSSSKNWESEIGASFDIVLEQASVATVRHVLSKAVSRTPQKVLWRCLESHSAALLASANGVALLEVLVRFGTEQTISAICDKVTEHIAQGGKDALEKFALDGPGAPLLAALAYRKDANRIEKRSALLTAVLPTLIAAVPSNPGARSIVVAAVGDEDIGTAAAEKIAKSKPIAQFVQQTLSKKAKDQAALKFLALLIEKAAAVETASKLVSKTVYKSIDALMGPNAKYRPRDVILRSLAQFGHVTVVDAMSGAVSQWNSLKDDVRRDSRAIALSFLVARTSAEAASALCSAIALTVEKWEALLATKHVPTLKVLAAMKRRLSIDPKRSEYSDTALEILDVAEDLLIRTTRSSAEATEERVKERQANLTAKRQRPLVSVEGEDSSDGDNDADQPPTNRKQPATPRSGAAATPASSAKKPGPKRRRLSVTQEAA